MGITRSPGKTAAQPPFAARWASSAPLVAVAALMLSLSGCVPAAIGVKAARIAGPIQTRAVAVRQAAQQTTTLARSLDQRLAAPAAAATPAKVYEPLARQVLVSAQATQAAAVAQVATVKPLKKQLVSAGFAAYKAGETKVKSTLRWRIGNFVFWGFIVLVLLPLGLVGLNFVAARLIPAGAVTWGAKTVATSAGAKVQLPPAGIWALVDTAAYGLFQLLHWLSNLGAEIRGWLAATWAFVKRVFTGHWSRATGSGSLSA